MFEKTKINEKEAGVGPFFCKKVSTFATDFREVLHHTIDTYVTV